MINKNNFSNILVVLYILLGVALIIDYGYQRSLNQQLAAKVNQLTNQNKIIDSQFKAEVLSNMFVFYYSFDALNQHFTELNESRDAIAAMLEELESEDRLSGQVMADFAHYKLRLTSLTQQLDDFRAYNATTKNSFVFLTRLLVEYSDEFADQQFSPAELRSMYSVLAGITQVRATMDISLLPGINQESERLCQLSDCQTSHTLVASFYQHSQHFIDNYPSLLSIYQALMQNEREQLINNIQIQQTEFLQREQSRESIVYWLIIGYLVFTLLLMIYFFIDQKKYQVLSERDNLTKLNNRQAYELSMNRALTAFEQQEIKHALVLLDIDHFKQVNDNYGHDIGDIILKEVVEIIKANSRSHDQIFRYGGEEFAIISTNVENLDNQLERIRSAVENFVFTDVGHITISIGATDFRSKDGKYGIFKRADKCLYQAKSLGRNRIEIDRLTS